VPYLGKYWSTVHAPTSSSSIVASFSCVYNCAFLVELVLLCASYYDNGHTDLLHARRLSSSFFKLPHYSSRLSILS
jgi:hypothetical protein